MQQQTKSNATKFILPNKLPRPTTEIAAPPSYINKQDPLALGIYYHENSRYEWSAYYFSVAASNGDPTGVFLYAISMRHGWGMPQDEARSFRLLSQCTDMYEDLLGKNANIPTHLPL